MLSLLTNEITNFLCVHLFQNIEFQSKFAEIHFSVEIEVRFNIAEMSISGNTNRSIDPIFILNFVYKVLFWFLIQNGRSALAEQKFIFFSGKTNWSNYFLAEDHCVNFATGCQNSGSRKQQYQQQQLINYTFRSQSKLRTLSISLLHFVLFFCSFIVCVH